MYQVATKGLRMWLVLFAVASSLVLMGDNSIGASVPSQSNLRCGSDQLSVSWRGTTGGLVGTVGDLFWIRNVGVYPCVISGYPNVAVDLNGKRFAMDATDLKGHVGNDQMGIAARQPIPSIRLMSGRVASFWVFGNDVMSNCINGNALRISLKSLRGTASIPVPRGFQYWTYCGGILVINPLLPGISGSDPPRPLKSEIMQ